MWEDSSAGRPWLADLWEEHWPSETFTQGEGLPPGPLSTVGTFHNQPGSPHTLALRLQDEVNGKRVVPIRFNEIVKGDGTVGLSIRGEVGVFYHRWRDTDPIMVKLECPDGDGDGLYRVYTWWVAVKRRYKQVNDRWVPV